jgi:hypothetical protein
VALVEGGQAPYLADWNGQPNALGNAALADVVARFLAEQTAASGKDLVRSVPLRALLEPLVPFGSDQSSTATDSRF